MTGSGERQPLPTKAEPVYATDCDMVCTMLRLDTDGGIRAPGTRVPRIRWMIIQSFAQKTVS